MSFLFSLLVSRLQTSVSPTEREALVSAAAKHHVFTCQQLGVILMSLCYAAEREKAARQLAPCVVDPENAPTHLLPFLACETSSVRTAIIDAVTERS